MNKNYQIYSVLNQNPKTYGKNRTRGKTYNASSIKHFSKDIKLIKMHEHKHHNTIVPPMKRPEIYTKWTVEQWFLWIQSFLVSQVQY